MHGYITLITAILSPAFAMVFTVNPGPKNPPTNGEIWPKPQFQLKQDKYYALEPSHFKIKISEYTCDILMSAIDRYDFSIHVLTNLSSHYANKQWNPEPWADANYQGLVRELNIHLKNPCEKYPHANMDEAYNLRVGTASFLWSSSIWGIIRGLESFSHLFYLSPNYNQIRVNATEITDFPRYSHRGVLLDTSRHYFSLDNILKTLDAMAMNKMNVFHWHIVDDQSFPFESAKLPDLSRRGAFHPTMVYTRNDIDTVINYAKERGIRVIPEFDVPGHTRSWGVAYPHILTECYDNKKKFIGLGPLNPIRNTTYKLLRNLLNEVQERFPEQYLHVGGDEVELGCWQSNPVVKAYMQEHNLTPRMLHGKFMQQVLMMLGPKTKAIVWQELFDEGVSLSSDTLVQVWKNDWVSEMTAILQAGYKVIYSSEWYLDHLEQTFIKMYLADPRQEVADVTHNDALTKNIVGGEACMWGEMADDRNVISRMWPRSSAVAERLWSPAQSTLPRNQMSAETLKRIEEHVCRMNRRGIAAEPATGPGFCVT